MNYEIPQNPSTPKGFRPPKAYRDDAFLSSSAGRHIRMLCEMGLPAERLKKFGIQHTLVLFGSARILSPEKARHLFETVTARVGTDQPGELKGQDRADLEKALWAEKASVYYDAARLVARELAAWSLSLERPEDRFYICSGGGPGIMEAANRGAHEAGAPSVGLSISLPFEQEVNPYCTPDLTFEFHYFMIRKWWFLYLAKGLLTFPGGFGTMDELFEMLTLIQTKKTRKPISIILYGSEFWNEVVNFRKLADWGVISHRDIDLFKIYDDPKEAAQAMIDDVTRNFIEGKAEASE